LFGLIWHAIYLVTFVASLYALIEAVRTPAAAFELMDKQTKKLWVILTGVATGLSLLAVLSGSGMFVILGLVATLVFLLDVRPAVKGVGGNSNNGPYGPW
jgi:asparagine N-glycosylation enzyme membrane subunit Stt3